jgi:hypothetical protein
MQDIPPAIAVYPVHHLPILKSYADQRGLVGRIHHSVPTEMEVDAGPGVLGRVLDTLSGRSPLDRWEELMAHHDTARLVGQALPAHAVNDDPVGRVLDRLDDRGPMQLFTACAVRAVPRFGVERRYVHLETTSRSGWGESQCAEAQDVPCSVTDGSSTDQRPDLQPFVLAMLGVDRAGPIWGKPAEGHASATTLQTTLWSESAQLMARHGVQPGAYIYSADAALVTADHLAALGDRVFSTRLPATDSDCAGGIAEAVAHNPWAEVGGLAQTPPTKHRAKTVYQVAAGRVT